MIALQWKSFECQRLVVHKSVRGEIDIPVLEMLSLHIQATSYSVIVSLFFVYL